MHKSKLAGFIIDCETDELQTAAEFWSAALGMPTRALPGEDAQKYVELVDPLAQMHVEVQAVSHASRVHLDIESDDIEAEVRRLETLGARRIAQISTWWVMEAPTGQRFCVVHASSPEFATQASSWP